MYALVSHTFITSCSQRNGATILVMRNQAASSSNNHDSDGLIYASLIVILKNAYYMEKSARCSNEIFRALKNTLFD